MTTEIQELDTVIKGPDGYILTSLKRIRELRDAIQIEIESIDKRLATEELGNEDKGVLTINRSLCERLLALCMEEIERAEAAQREEKA